MSPISVFCRPAVVLGISVLALASVSAADPSATLILPKLPANPPAAPTHISSSAASELELQVRPFEVSVSVLGSLGVTFTVLGQNAEDPNAFITWATVVAVPAQAQGETAGFKPKDELVRLNDHPIRGLTLRQFADLVYSERQKGDLSWKVSRGVMGRASTMVFNGTDDTSSISLPSAKPTFVAAKL